MQPPELPPTAAGLQDFVALTRGRSGSHGRSIPVDNSIEAAVAEKHHDPRRAMGRQRIAHQAFIERVVRGEPLGMHAPTLELPGNLRGIKAFLLRELFGPADRAQICLLYTSPSPRDRT